MNAENCEQKAKANPLSSFWLEKRLSQSASEVPVKTGSLLDIGCGEGFFIKKILENIKGLKAAGIDVSEKNLKLAQKNSPRARFVKSDACRLPFKDDSFECVTALELLEHVTRPDKVLLEIRRVLKKGGTFVCTIPNSDALQWKIIWSFWVQTLGKHWEGAHTDITADELAQSIRRAGLIISKKHKIMWGNLVLIVARKT